MRDRLRAIVGALTMLMILSGISDRAFAVDAKTQRRLAPTAHAVADDFVFVPTDAVLKQVGQTRDQWNLRDPKAEREWRRAFVVEGTAQDSAYYADIRKNDVPPAKGIGSGRGH
ncbi:hypothetical protein [Asticcacaulis sp. EMRT-3]|uniref:hypothetical protein n=1 Tax=Asticcacaulis sp. EMRT-3 TaxID=3040349 RepID=UPI0024AF6B2D|nr:hypothetical protein [Asticcacaulis sp. EMRT-3]MDI7776575.1 hypothetical protein [Asticcacaulis sp. EMRT-3]